MKGRVQELLTISDQLYSKRFPLLTLWQSFAEQFNPLRADMTRVRYISEEFASYLMTGRPVLAHRELANAIGTILRPRNQTWFECSAGNDDLDNDKANKQWLEAAAKTMRRVMFDHKTQFTRATKEGDADYILFGQCVIEPRLNKAMNGMLYRTWHLRDCVWAENAELQIDWFCRKWNLAARQSLQTYSKDVDGRERTTVMKRARENPMGSGGGGYGLGGSGGQGGSVGADCRHRHIVLPADEYDSYGKDEGSKQARKRGPHPFVNIVVDEDEQTILEETPQFELGYVIPRWVTIGGFSQYAYSPTAIVALPDARMLQQMMLTLIEVGQKITDPPMIAVGDAINGGVNLYAGSITWVDPDYDERTGEVLRPIALDHSGVPFGQEFYDRIEKIHQEAFFLNVLHLPDYDGEKMTAFEVNERVKEYIQRATPLFEPMDLEYNGQLCGATFRTMERMGAFGSVWDRPPGLRGRDIEFKFSNPLVAAESERKTLSFQKVGQLLAAAMQIDPAVKADLDVDIAFRDAYDGTGAPAKWLVDKDKADQVKAAARQQEAAAQQAADLGHMGEQAGKMANAVKNVGDAATSLQDAGLTQ